jgi:hypothetical protein
MKIFDGCVVWRSVVLGCEDLLCFIRVLNARQRRGQRQQLLQQFCESVLGFWPKVVDQQQSNAMIRLRRRIDSLAKQIAAPKARNIIARGKRERSERVAPGKYTK